MQNIYRTSLVVALMCAVHSIILVQQSQAVTQLTNEFWVSPSTNTFNLGTLPDPFDGSTEPKFDGVMNSMPPNCMIHLLSGTYQTSGTQTNAWTIKTGQRIMGSGIDKTIIHLNYYTVGVYGIGNPGGASGSGTNIEFSDLTVDGSGTLNYSGIAFYGDHSAIRRVKAINFNSVGEIFPLAIFGYSPQLSYSFYSEGNVIEECEVITTNSGNFSAIAMAGGPSQYLSGAIRNNRVIGNRPTGYNSRFAINVACTHDVVVEGNYAYGTDAGIYSDSGPNTNLTVLHNSFQNVWVGLLFTTQSGYSYAHTNITCGFNIISLAPAPSGSAAAAFDFEPLTNDGNRNILMFGNTILCYGALGPGLTEALKLNNVNGFVFVNNRVDSGIVVYTANCTGGNVYNNTGLDGGPWTWSPNPTYSIGGTWSQDPPHGIARKTVNGDYTLENSDRYVALSSSSTISISLPDAALAGSGKEFIVTREDTSGLGFTLVPFTGQHLNGGTASLSITKGDNNLATTTIVSDGSSWWAR
jgi:hypothetical protein